jgi:hypothetical protein
MPRVCVKTGRVLLIVALFATCGAHWVVLQSVAWTRMLVSFSQRSGFTHAIVSTFDGRHPCTLCERIEHGKQTEQKQDVQVVVAKLNLFHHQSAVVLVRADLARNLEAASFAADTRSHAPPLPPPRVA